MLSPAEIGQHFAGHGTIAVDADTIRVVQPMDAINIALRRAGLDANPGWLPWLGKRLVFVFVDPDAWP